MKLTQEENEYFDAMDYLFMSAGWKNFIEDIKNNRAALNESWSGITDTDELLRAQGRIDAYNQILGYEDLTDEYRKQKQEAPEPETTQGNPLEALLDELDATTV